MTTWYHWFDFYPIVILIVVITFEIVYTVNTLNHKSFKFDYQNFNINDYETFIIQLKLNRIKFYFKGDKHK